MRGIICTSRHRAYFALQNYTKSVMILKIDQILTKKIKKDHFVLRSKQSAYILIKNDPDNKHVYLSSEPKRFLHYHQIKGKEKTHLCVAALQCCSSKQNIRKLNN